MLYIRPEALHHIAKENGWLHESGRLKDTIHVRRMAAELEVAPSVISRAYDGAPATILLLEKLTEISEDVTLNDLVERRSA